MDKRYFVYIGIIIFCIISIGIGVYAQVFYKDAGNDKLMLGTHVKETKAKEEEESIKSEFDNMFSNTLVYVTNTINNNVILNDRSKDLIYTEAQESRIVKDKYEINIKLPNLNIVGPNAEMINEKIEEIFIPKATSILNNEITTYTIYNVDYAGFVNANILSLVIRATLKEGNNPQRVMIVTFNYNLANGQSVSFDEILEMKNVTKTVIQNKINKEISEISTKTQTLMENLGFEVHKRNINDSMYKIENTHLYFIGPNSYVYILYAYGNTENTSDIDIIIF